MDQDTSTWNAQRNTYSNCETETLLRNAESLVGTVREALDAPPGSSDR